MKNTDLLDVIGEVNAAYYEDMAQHFSGKRQRIRSIVMRFGAAAAVIGVMTVTAVTFASVFREGIQTTQQPASSGIQTASSYTQATDRSESSKPEQTLPTDLYEVVQNTTVTETSASAETTTELIIPFPADTEMPDNSLEQDVGSRFMVNYLSKSGMLAVTLNDVQLYDSLDEAGLTFDDLTESFRENYDKASNYFEGKSDSFSIDQGNQAAEYLGNPEGEEEKDTNWRFIKARITVENINAVSIMSGLNGVVLPDNTVRYDFSDYDFDLYSLGFGVMANRESEKMRPEHGYYYMESGIHYNTAAGRFYDDSVRRDLIHVEPGEAITFEIGAFLPKFATPYLDHVTSFYGFDIGTDLKPFYFFGNSLARPHVEFHFDE